MSSYTEVSVGKPLQFEHKIKINDLVSLLKQKALPGKEGFVLSNVMEIFPDVKVVFILWKLNPTNKEIFLFVTETGSEKGSSFAGKVEVDIEGVTETDSFGDVQKNEYVRINHIHNQYQNAVDLSNRLLGPFLYTDDGDKKINVEVKWTIYMQQPISVTQHEEKIPESLMNQESLSVVGAAMMEDVSTADLIIKCGAETFRVHKVILCSRSPVFRAMLQGDMMEARKGEVTVTDVDSGTFAAVLTYIYTGELEEGQDLNNMIYAAEKYDLPGLRELLFLKIKSEDIKEKFIPDLLIIADKYHAGQLKKLALEKIRANRKILEDKDFQNKLNNFQHILFDLLKRLS